MPGAAVSLVLTARVYAPTTIDAASNAQTWAAYVPAGIDEEEYVATSGLVAVSPLVSTASPWKILTTKSSTGAPVATAVMLRVWSSVRSNGCFGPHPPGGTVPWKTSL